MRTIISMVCDKAIADAPIVNCARDVFELMSDICSVDREHFVVLVLNARNLCVYKQTVSIGTLTASLVHPREVFKPAIISGGAAIICVHNHPSGDYAPSSEDRDVTHRIVKAGGLLGIPLADHIIVSTTGYYSFREHGLL